MDNQLQRYSVRNLASQSVMKIKELCDSTRLPAGAIIEDAVEMLWEAMECDVQAQRGEDS